MRDELATTPDLQDDVRPVPSLCGHVTAGPDGRIASVSDTFLSWTGTARGEVVGQRRFEDFLSPAGQIIYQARAWSMTVFQARRSAELKAMGCRFALDDFGSGMSSFGYLRHLPVDFLKIDGRFVKELLDDRINHAIVEAINRVGQVMGLRTIAEFVEDARTLEALRAIGVDFAQGYGVHKPAPLFGREA